MYGSKKHIWFNVAVVYKMKKQAFINKFKHAYPDEDLASIYEEIKANRK